MRNQLLKRVLQRIGFVSKVPVYENVQYELRDKEGNLKKLFHDGLLNRIFLKIVRSFVKQPSFEETGLFNYLALYGIRLNFLTGRWVNSLNIANLVTTAGKGGVSSRINGAGGAAAFTYIAIGTGVTAAAAGDTTLQTEITTGGGARAAATASQVTTTTTNDTAQDVLTFTFTSSFAVTESGVLNAASSGTLLCRQVFSAINVVSGDSLQVTWKVSVS